MATPAVGKNVSLEELLLQVERLEQRVTALEKLNSDAPALASAEAAVAIAPEVEPVRTASLSFSGGTFATVAKAVLGFAGAYLLRAIAESGTVPASLGILAGIAYALFWLIWSVRLPAEDRAGSTLYGLTSALIFAGLLWENCVSVHGMPVPLAAASIVMYAYVGMVLAWRRELPGTAAIVVGIMSVLALALLVATHDLVPLTATLLAVAAGTEIAACGERWLRLRALPALAADLAVAIVAWVITRPQGIPESYPPFGMSAVVSLQMTLLLIYVCGMGYRTLFTGSDITRFEITQNVITIGLFIWGVLMGREAPGARLVVEAFCMIAGAACYAIAVLLLAHKSRQRNFLMYGIFGLALVMAGISIRFSGFVLVVVWCTLAIIASWLGTHEHRISLQLHSPAFLIAAAFGSGQLEFARQALHGTSAPADTRLLEIVIVSIALALCYAMAGSDETGKARIPAALVAAMLCWTLLGLGGAAITAVLGPESMFSSTLRTGLICGLALTLSRGAERRVELAWLLYPLMLYGAYHLLMEDFPHGRPTALALSLLFYGGTLLLLTRLVRTEKAV
jgi:hypothetical protein